MFKECPEIQLVFLNVAFILNYYWCVWFGGFASIFLLVFPIFSCMIFYWLGASEVRSKENKTPYEMLLCYWCEVYQRVLASKLLKGKQLG